MVRVVDAVRVRIKYPAARWEVLVSLAALSDPEYQTRVWVRHELPCEDYYDSLDRVVHSLFDDWAVLPDPNEAVGLILVDGPELNRLRQLGMSLSTILADLGESDDEAYLKDPRWSDVVRIASAALSAMVGEGPFEADRVE